MSFVERLKDRFLYTGDGIKEAPKEAPEKPFKFPRVNLSDPVKRMSEVKEEAFNTIKQKQEELYSVTEHTKDLIYRGYYNEVDKGVEKHIPFEEARLLFKRYLEDEVFDESEYTNVDLAYLNQMIAITKNLRSYDSLTHSGDEERNSIIDRVVSSKYLPEILEVLKCSYKINAIDYVCTKGYIICGYSYNDSRLSNIVTDIKKPYFCISLYDTKYYALKDVESIINDGSTEEEKREYLISKFGYFFHKFIIDEDIPTRVLCVLDTIFNKWLDLPVVSVEPKSEDKQEQQEDTTPINKLKTQAEVVEKMVATTKYNFVDKYEPLVLSDSVPPTAIVDAAITDIRKAMEDGYELTGAESMLLRALQERRV